MINRDDGPAVEKLNGEKFWYLGGFLHRNDGPAVEDKKLHYLYDKYISIKKFNSWILRIKFAIKCLR